MRTGNKVLLTGLGRKALRFPRSQYTGTGRGFTFQKALLSFCVTNAGWGGDHLWAVLVLDACVQWALWVRAAERIVTWLILPVVICLSQRLSHACLSINKFVL